MFVSRVECPLIDLFARERTWAVTARKSAISNPLKVASEAIEDATQKAESVPFASLNFLLVAGGTGTRNPLSVLGSALIRRVIGEDNIASNFRPWMHPISPGSLMEKVPS